MLTSSTPALTVGQLSQHITTLVRTDVILSDIAVQGEISNFVRAKSGHLYFSLKDAKAAISCVMWRGRAASLIEMPREGQQVILSGRLDFYAPRGSLQIIVNSLRPLGGVGELYRRFEALKQQLQAEGLFDEARKRPLPPLPRRIGLITSATGAALRDILRVLSHRWPLVQVLVVPSLVQGIEAPASLVAALYQLYQRNDIDVIMLARGGGSIEDLWAFNDESVARMVAESPVPVVSGVGHETDFTIVDFVADVRTPTPSAAAAAVTPDQMEFRRSLAGAGHRLTERIRQRLNLRQLALERLQTQLQHQAPLYRIDQQRLHLDDLARRLTVSMRRQLQQRRQMIHTRAQQLDALNPSAVLARGYAIVQDDAGHVIQSAQQVMPGQMLHIRLADGHFSAKAIAPKPEPNSGAPAHR